MTVPGGVATFSRSKAGAVMTKADLIERVQATRPDLSKRQVSDVVDAVFENAQSEIRDLLLCLVEIEVHGSIAL